MSPTRLARQSNRLSNEFNATAARVQHDSCTSRLRHSRHSIFSENVSKARPRAPHRYAFEWRRTATKARKTHRKQQQTSRRNSLFTKETVVDCFLRLPSAGSRSTLRSPRRRLSNAGSRVSSEAPPGSIAEGQTLQEPRGVDTAGLPGGHSQQDPIAETVDAPLRPTLPSPRSLGVRSTRGRRRVAAGP